METSTAVDAYRMDNINNNNHAPEIKETIKLEDLTILKTIGTGTFARVSLCCNIKTSSFYALKVMPIQELVRLKQLEHTKNERSILEETDHPFLIQLKWCHKDPIFVYFLFPYVCGGELFTHLRRAGRFSSESTLFYASEIISALAYLHSLSIVYRDLKPENLLLDAEGHIVITDFGFAKHVEDTTWTLCGTPDYLAPEIIQSKGHNKAVDWWALGVLIFEMLAGYPPFYDESPLVTYEKILSGKFDFPSHVQTVEKDLIKKLLVIDRTKRLGGLKSGAEDVKNHRWFQTVDWDDVIDKKQSPPFVPDVSCEWDSSNFESYPETDWSHIGPVNQKQMDVLGDF